MDITLIAIAIFILIAIVFLTLFLFKSVNKKSFLAEDGSVFDNQSDLDLASLYFARANVMHNKNRFDLSANNLIIANRIKSKTVKYNINKIIQQSTILFDKSIHYEPNYDNSDTQCVFIVGMPRSGSTLIESILSLNTLVTDLGETDNLEISYNDWLHQADLGSSTKLSDL